MALALGNGSILDRTSRYSGSGKQITIDKLALHVLGVD